MVYVDFSMESDLCGVAVYVGNVDQARESWISLSQRCGVGYSTDMGCGGDTVTEWLTSLTTGQYGWLTDCLLTHLP